MPIYIYAINMYNFSSLEPKAQISCCFAMFCCQPCVMLKCESSTLELDETIN